MRQRSLFLLVSSSVFYLSSRKVCNGFSPRTGVRVVSCPDTRIGRVGTTRLSVFFGDKEKTKINSTKSSRGDISTRTTAADGIAPTTVQNIDGMPDLERDLTRKPDSTNLNLDKEEQEMAMSLAEAEFSLEKLLVPIGFAVIAAVVATAANSAGVTMADASEALNAFKEDPQGFVQSSLDGLGPLAIVYFGLLYIVAELLAIPATPLTLSSGALFGWAEGSLVVLMAGTISAMIGFFIGKTFLRQWVEGVLEENPKFKKLDTAIGAEGFKLLVLVRLSPIFPFSLLNYTYGASSISFPTFAAGTLLGFTPSTIGYVYTGMVGKELLLGEGTQPWYFYAGGVTLLLAFLKLVTDVATEIVEAIDDESTS